MSTKYTAVPNPRKDNIASIYRTVLALKEGYEQLTGGPREGEGKVLNQADQLAIDGRIDERADFEFDTWTPTLEGETTSGTYTYTAQWATYMRVGDMVFIHGRIDLSGITTAATGGLIITGLPHTTAALTSPSTHYWPVYHGYWQGLSLPGADSGIGGLVKQGDNFIFLYSHSPSGFSRLQPEEITSSFDTIFSGVYMRQ
jgi:hypothetical protein